MNIGSVLKTIGTAALSTVPGGAQIIAVANAFLPHDKQLTSDHTGEQAQAAIQTLSPELQEKILIAEIADRQAEHHETQETIRAGDTNSDPFIRRNRPGMADASLLLCAIYVIHQAVLQLDIDHTVVSALLTLPLAYMGLRQLDKGIGSSQWLGKK